MKTSLGVCCALLLFGVASVTSAQDAVDTDPAHYKVEFENARVRILRFHYGAHEKSIMHSHPDAVAVFLTDGKIKFTYPDGKTQETSGHSGQSLFTAAQVHLPENLGDNAMDGVIVELKGAK